MSVTVVETDMRQFEGALDDFVTHWYPKKLSYRLSGMSPPQVGDIALCGHVKQRSAIGPAAAAKFPLCDRCDATLKAMRRGR